jgi:hypothetical protein
MCIIHGSVDMVAPSDSWGPNPNTEYTIDTSGTIFSNMGSPGMSCYIQGNFVMFFCQLLLQQVFYFLTSIFFKNVIFQKYIFVFSCPSPEKIVCVWGSVIFSWGGRGLPPKVFKKNFKGNYAENFFVQKVNTLTCSLCLVISFV